RAAEATARVQQSEQVAVGQRDRANQLAGSLQVAVNEKGQALGKLQDSLKRVESERNRDNRGEKAAVQAQAEAEENETRARQEERRAREAGAKEEAERLREARLLYASDMQLAANAWEKGNTQRASSLMEAYIPRPGEEDRRGFDWRYQWQLSHHNVVTF